MNHALLEKSNRPTPTAHTPIPTQHDDKTCNHFLCKQSHRVSMKQLGVLVDMVQQEQTKLYSYWLGYQKKLSTCVEIHRGLSSK